MARPRAGHARPLRTDANGLCTGTGGNVKPVKAPQAGLRGQLPTAWGAFCAGEAEGFPAVCGGNGQSGKARRNPPVR